MALEELKKYSLVLKHQGKNIFASQGDGIAPLLDMIDHFKSSNVSNCVLIDRVVGLAAAKLIIYSKIICSVETRLASSEAIALLQKNQISITTVQEVKNILNRDRSDICFMEKLALESPGVEKFALAARAKINPGQTTF